MIGIRKCFHQDIFGVKMVTVMMVRLVTVVL